MSRRKIPKLDKNYALQLAYETLVNAIQDPEASQAQKIRAAKELADIANNLPQTNSGDDLSNFLMGNE